MKEECGFSTPYLCIHIYFFFFSIYIPFSFFFSLFLSLFPSFSLPRKIKKTHIAYSYMLKRISVFSSFILLRNIVGHPLTSSATEPNVDLPVTYESPEFWERLISIAFLVLLGGVFAGNLSSM